MKIYMGILILLLACIPLYAEESIGNPPTTKQIDKIVAAAWKEPVTSIDISLYKQTIKPKKSVEEIRQMFEDFFDKQEGPKEKLSPQELEQRNRNVQLNVENATKVQETGGKTKKRIRIDGCRQRIDEVFGWPEMVLLKDTSRKIHQPQVVLGPNTPYDMTYINLGDKNKGDNRSLTYYHNNKSVMIQNKKSWAKNTIIPDLARVSSYFQGLLGINKGTVLEPVYVSDANKIEELSKTGLMAGVLRVMISPDPNSPDKRDRIKIKSDEYSCGTVIICDRGDYSHIYYLEVCNPGTGKPLLIKQCDNFDNQGFPHNATIIKYDINGNLEEKEIYTIEKVELNSVIAKDVFEFTPPEEYEVTEIDSNGTSKVIREKGGIEGAMLKYAKAVKERDIKTLKELLGHKIWQVRLRSLQALDKFLDQDKKGLKELAEMLKNDEKQEVNQEAKRILNRLESQDPNGK